MDESPLARLSPELRNEIYEYTFIDSIVYLNEFDKGVGALVQTCSQIRREARLLLFSKADIVLSISHDAHGWYRKFDGICGPAVQNAFGEAALLSISAGYISIDYSSLRCSDRKSWLERFGEDFEILRLKCPGCFPAGFADKGSSWQDSRYFLRKGRMVRRHYGEF